MINGVRKRDLKSLAPEYLGYDVEYAPVEQLMKGILSVELPWGKILLSNFKEALAIRMFLQTNVYLNEY